jgi:hypothetical protein
MTEENFFISPLEELVQEWLELPLSEEERLVVAYRWGADQQLEACCKYIGEVGAWFADPEYRLRELRAALRPKSPSLKEQALHELESFACSMENLGMDVDTIRRAIESLH